MSNEGDFSVLIGEILYKHFAFDWARFSMYYVEDIYYCIPKLIFRLQDCNDYSTIQRCIEGFKGNLRWVVYKTRFSRKGNHILSPSICFEIEDKIVVGESSEKDFFTIEEYKRTCDLAIKDIPGLAKHIDKSLSER